MRPLLLGSQFTHVSFDDFRVVRDTLAGKKRTTKNRLVPYTVMRDAIYTHPTPIVK
jgi:pyruvate/2-oxoglutarate dehydrogenase complex dihydrolipoamide dehydrogenase (E3) component